MNNLVKILATLGLIVAIALILKGVFGVGEIGVKKISKNLTNKSIPKLKITADGKIIFDKCWDKDNFDNLTHYLAKNDSNFEKTTYEIDLQKKIMVEVRIRKDSSIQWGKENGLNPKKIELFEFPIVAISNDYIETVLAGGIIQYSYVFDLKKGEIIQNGKFSYSEPINWKCDQF